MLRAVVGLGWDVGSKGKEGAAMMLRVVGRKFYVLLRAMVASLAGVVDTLLFWL